MKAVIYKEYGKPEVLKIDEVAMPVPRENEVLVKVLASSVNFGDLMARNFGNLHISEFNMPAILWLPARLAFGFSKPKRQVLGNEFAGVVDSVGNNVTLFRKGDHVFGYTGEKMGCYAEYACITENGFIAHKPDNFTFEQAAVIPYGMLMAMNILKNVDVHPGQKALVIGASGGIGSAMVQLLKEKNVEVTGVCGTARVNYVKSLGADKVVDYTTEDFKLSDEKYNLIIDILGRNSFSAVKPLLVSNGIYLPVSFKTGKLFQMFWTRLFCNKKIICSLAIPKKEDIQTIAKWMVLGKLKCFIDKTFPFANIADAHRYAESGNKRGSIAIIVNNF